MDELQPPEAAVSVDPIPATASTSQQHQPPPSPSENPTTATNVSNPVNQGPGLAPKRQRRPSVRLGEIGEQSFDHSHSQAHSRRTKTWRYHKDPSLAAKTSKTRPLTNLVNGRETYQHESLENNDENHNYGFDFVGKKTKSKKPAKRVRTNWASSAPKFEAAATKAAAAIENDSTFGEENHENDEFREFEVEASESPMREQSPVHSVENQNMGLQFWDRRAMRARLSHSESLDRLDNNNNNVNMNNTVNGIHNEMNSGDDNRSGGVRDWLIGLGLGRYAPVFEIHEVDDEVLPMLTLEDLKDMGINAVGSRRKMYSAILKLQKGFS